MALPILLIASTPAASTCTHPSGYMYHTEVQSSTQLSTPHSWRVLTTN